MDNVPGRNFQFLISESQAGERLDAFLANQIEELTRSRAQGLIRTGHVTVNNRAAKASHKLKEQDYVALFIPQPRSCRLEPEQIELSILYEDDSLIVLDKPAGMVVHPAPGHATGTLVHGLLKHCRNLSGIGDVLRPGIVHRLDKDTSGLMVIAKSDLAHTAISKQFKSGEIFKEYEVFVHGGFQGDEGRIDLPIGRDRGNRKRMAVVQASGRQAVTLWRVTERWGNVFARLSVRLLTGRTHQIRVHLSHEGHPVVGDALYGHKRTWWRHRYPHATPMLGDLLVRQMLHALRLGFTHPETGLYMEFNSPLPEDMINVGTMLAAIGNKEKIS